MTGRSCAALLGLALAGCDSRALVVGESSAPSSLGGGERGGSEPRCPDAAGARSLAEECWPTRHVGRWRGFVTGGARYRHVLAEPLDLPSGELLLEIAPAGTGTLAFGAEPEPPACTGGAPPSDAGAGFVDAEAIATDAGAGALGSSSCSADGGGGSGGARPGLLLGYRYELNGLQMSGAPEQERKQDPNVSFSLLIAEPWRDWCGSPPVGLGDAPCSCNAEGCSVSPDALEVSLSLSRDGLALRGTLISSSDVELVAGLELIRP